MDQNEEKNVRETLSLMSRQELLSTAMLTLKTLVSVGDEIRTLKQEWSEVVAGKADDPQSNEDDPRLAR